MISCFYLQIIKVLEDLVESIEGEAPLRIVSFSDFQKFGKLPRSSDNLTFEISMATLDMKLVFISHRWLRPWHTKEE
jgi:hypothetical protein